MVTPFPTAPTLLDVIYLSVLHQHQPFTWLLFELVSTKPAHSSHRPHVTATRSPAREGSESGTWRRVAGARGRLGGCLDWMGAHLLVQVTHTCVVIS